MTVRQAERSAGAKLVRDDPDVDGCGFVHPADGPRGISFMVIRGRVARVDVESGRTSTEAGARIGDTETKIKKLYGRRVRVEPHAYAEGAPWHYLIVPGPDRKHALVFETDGHRVTSYRAGRRPEVEYVEGCS
jgi:hypothetical protein